MKINGFQILAQWTDSTFPNPTHAIILGVRHDRVTNQPAEYVVATIDAKDPNPTEWFWGTYFNVTPIHPTNQFHNAQTFFVEKATHYGMPTLVQTREARLARGAVVPSRHEDPR